MGVAIGIEFLGGPLGIKTYRNWETKNAVDTLGRVNDVSVKRYQGRRYPPLKRKD